jgi:hypothetical protein
MDGPSLLWRFGNHVLALDAVWVGPSTPSLRAKRQSDPCRRKRIDGLLRRCAPLRKRFAFVAGNDGERNFESNNTRLIDVDASAIIEL